MSNSGYHLCNLCSEQLPAGSLNGVVLSQWYTPNGIHEMRQLKKMAITARKYAIWQNGKSTIPNEIKSQQLATAQSTPIPALERHTGVAKGLVCVCVCVFKNGQNAGAVFPPLAYTCTYSPTYTYTCVCIYIYDDHHLSSFCIHMHPAKIKAMGKGCQN